MFSLFRDFFRWLWSIVKSVLNGMVKAVVFVIVLALLLGGLGLMAGDGLSDKMVLELDLRRSMSDANARALLDIGSKHLSIMDVVMGLDRAQRDKRVNGVFLRVGSGDLSVPQGEELKEALKRFQDSGKFVIAHSQGFYANGLGDYLAVAGADSIWMQPVSSFFPSGTATSTPFLKGLFDKLEAIPQFVQRYEYKNAANVFTQSDYTPAHREATTRMLQSWYDSATGEAAAARKLDPAVLVAFLDESPATAEEAKASGLITDLGYDDDARQAAKKKSGEGTNVISFADYARATKDRANAPGRPVIALVHAAGDIVESADDDESNPLSDSVEIGGDRYSKALRDAADDKNVKAILLRVDSPGGSAIASDQILDAVNKARAAGKPVVVSMGSVAASGGYFISLSADRIVAEPGTLTGSIGVIWGKFAVGKTLQLAGVNARDIGIGKNALFLSGIEPWNQAEMAEVDAQADLVYNDFTKKVAEGRKLPLERVQEIARGRVWTGADAKERGLVDELGGFWTAVAAAKKLGGIGEAAEVSFKNYPGPKGFVEEVSEFLGASATTARALAGLTTLIESEPVKRLRAVVQSAPSGRAELKALDLPQ